MAQQLRVSDRGPTRGGATMTTKAMRSRKSGKGGLTTATKEPGDQQAGQADGNDKHDDPYARMVAFFRDRLVWHDTKTGETTYPDLSTPEKLAEALQRI